MCQLYRIVSKKVFYKDPPKSSASSAATFSSSSPSTTSSLVIPSNQNNNAPYGSTALRNLPTITSNDGIKSGGANTSALLPGHQFVWNIYNPQHIHMFHSILSGPAPWFFAHVHIPSGATTVYNDNDSDNDDNNGEEEEEFIDKYYKGTRISNMNSNQTVHCTGPCFELPIVGSRMKMDGLSWQFRPWIRFVCTV